MNFLSIRCSVVVACSILVGYLQIISCDSADKPGKVESGPVVDKDTVAMAKPELKADTLYNHLGLLLAGTMDDSLSSLYFRAGEFLERHRKLTTEKFSDLERDRLAPMRDWNVALLNESGVAENSFVFYPFSGADLVHAHALYPKAKEYLLVAMEPVGQIPDLLRADTSKIRSYVESIDFILRDIYQKSYFITKNMISDFNQGGKVSGTAPILLWTLSRMGYDIAAVRYYNIDSSGTKQQVQPTGSMGRGLVEFDFFRKGDTAVRTVSYLSCDASNDGFRSRPEYLKFLNARLPARVSSFVKSASYLMHYDSFSDIRSITLGRSGYLIQDDTGIPYAFFPKEGFRVRLFGAYEKPVRDFSSNLFQKDLDEAYRDSSVYAGKLDFSIGYHWGSRKQNQLVAVRP